MVGVYSDGSEAMLLACGTVQGQLLVQRACLQQSGPHTAVAPTNPTRNTTAGSDDGAPWVLSAAEVLVQCKLPDSAAMRVLDDGGGEHSAVLDTLEVAVAGTHCEPE